MIVKFRVLNKKAHSSEIDRMLWAEAEEVFKKKIMERLRKVKEDLEGLELLVEIDLQKGKAILIGENIPEEKIEIATSAMQKMK